jgi:hypothetical protein
MIIILNPAVSGTILGAFNFRHFFEQLIIAFKNILPQKEQKLFLSA